MSPDPLDPRASVVTADAFDVMADEVARLDAVVTAVRDLANKYDETERYGGQPWGDVPVEALRRALDEGAR